jgi:hypothetical protein
VVIFVTGGMWIIGYRAWGALLASRLRAAGCLVVALDYRNFPQGTVSHMAADVAAGVGWTLRHARGWGGDASRCVQQCCALCKREHEQTDVRAALLPRALLTWHARAQGDAGGAVRGGAPVRPGAAHPSAAVRPTHALPLAPLR